MRAIQLNVQIDSQQSCIKSSQQIEQRQSTLEKYYEKDHSRCSNSMNSDQHQFHKQSSKSKQLQNSETINWLKKRYLGKANEEYILNQDQNHQSSKQIIKIYKDLTNDSRNHSKENGNLDSHKLLVEDVCGYLQKNDINISKKQLTELLSKKGQQKKEQIGLDDFERIMMSQTLNDQFKKCLKTQDQEQSLVNQFSKRKSKIKINYLQSSSQKQQDPFYFNNSSLCDIQENGFQDKVIHSDQKQTQQIRQNDSHIASVSFTQERDNQLLNSNRIKRNIELDRAKFNNSIKQKSNNKQEEMVKGDSKQIEQQSYHQKAETQIESNRKNQNKSLKNLMNSIHFQVKRQQIIEQFKKIKTNQKAKVSEKYSVLESLLKLPKYQINKYKQSDPAIVKSTQEEDIQIQKTEVPLFLTQSGQLDNIQNIRFQNDNQSPRNLRSNNDLTDQASQENKPYIVKDYKENKNNQSQFSQNQEEEEDVDIADSQNDDEEQYELQMLVERAKYKAKKQFKNEITKVNENLINMINKKRINTLTSKKDTLESISNKKYPTQVSTAIRHSTIKNNAVNTSMQRMNTNKNSRNARAYSLNQQSNNQQRQTESQNYIQMLDESYDNNNYYRVNTKQDYTPTKINLNTIVVNSSTKDYQNTETLSKIEEQRQNKLFQQYNNNCLNQNQNYQLPQINLISKNTQNSKANHSNSNVSGSQNLKHQQENNQNEQKLINQVIRRKFVSVFNKIHNNNNNTSIQKINWNSQNSNSALQSLQNTKSYTINQPEYDVKNIYKQVNFIKDNLTSDNSKIAYKQMANKTYQIFQDFQNLNNFSHSQFQEPQLLTDNTLESNEVSNYHLKTLSNQKTNTSKRYKNIQIDNSFELKQQVNL